MARNSGNLSRKLNFPRIIVKGGEKGGEGVGGGGGGESEDLSSLIEETVFPRISVEGSEIRKTFSS